MRRGNTIGECGVFVASGHTATLVAADDASVLVLEYGHVQRFRFPFPEACISLMKLVLRRMQPANANRE